MRFWQSPREPLGINCRVRVYETKGTDPYAATVVVLTQFPSEVSGRSITNGIEEIATQVGRLQRSLRHLPFEVEAEFPITWISHYPPTVSVSGEEEFSPILLRWDQASYSFSDPRWEANITREALEEQIGCSLEV